MRVQPLLKAAALAVAFALAMASVAIAAPTAHWKLDDGQADPFTLTAVDSVAPASDGTWTAGTMDGGVPRWITGIAGGAADFGRNDGLSSSQSNPHPGTGDVITASGGKLDITGELTISAWVLYDEASGRLSTRHIAGKDQVGGAAGDAYSLKHAMGSSADQVQFLIASGGVNTNVTAMDTLTNYTANSTNSGWVHVAGVFKPGDFMRLFINGVLDAELTIGVPASIDSEPTTPFNIGKLSGSDTHSFNGSIDDVQLYNQALTAQQVVYLFDHPGQIVSVPGDFDGDGDVDGADFVAWQTNFPKASGASLAEGDADGDGDVDGADFVVWQTNFPFTPAPGVSNVPEPATVMLGLLGLIGSALWRQRRDRGV